MRQVRRINARPAVFNRDLDFGMTPVCNARGADAQPSPGCGVFDRVGKKVFQRAFKRRRFCKHQRQVRRNILFDGPSRVAEGRCVFGEGPVHDGRHLHSDRFVALASGLNPRIAHHLLDHIREAAGFILYQRAVFLYAARLADHAAGKVEPGRLNGGQRRAELM